MGLADSIHSLLSRPSFSWDVKSAPWTDRQDDQELYSMALYHWQHLHDNLPNLNSNKIFPKNRGIILLANLYSRAWDLCADIEDEIRLHTDATELIVDHMYRKRHFWWCLWCLLNHRTYTQSEVVRVNHIAILKVVLMLCFSV